MILYSVTVNIEPDVELEWLRWMKDEHIPEVLATGLFVESKFYRLLSELTESQGTTYSIQYFAKSLNEVNEYLENLAPDLISKHQDKFPNKFVAFRTVLESID